MNNVSLYFNVTESALKHRLRLWLLKATRVIENELRVPVHARQASGLRHWGLRDPVAHHRAVVLGGIALYLSLIHI